MFDNKYLIALKVYKNKTIKTPQQTQKRTNKQTINE